MNVLSSHQDEFFGNDIVARFEDNRIHVFDEERARLVLELLIKAGKVMNSKGICGDLLVDVGCGVGTVTTRLSKHFKRTIGVDVSEEKIRRAKETAGPNVEYRVGKAEELPLESGTADVITAFFCVHFMDLNKFVSECLRVLKPNGIALFWGDSYNSISLANPEISSNPTATHLFEDVDRELVERAIKQNHPEFHIFEYHQTLFRSINVTEKKSLHSMFYEGTVNLAQLRSHHLSIPFNYDMGPDEPIFEFIRKAKASWNLLDVPDEDIIVQASRKAFPIMIKK